MILSLLKHPPGFRWLHDGFGNNFRLTEIQCAVGRIQLSKLKNALKLGSVMR